MGVLVCACVLYSTCMFMLYLGVARLSCVFIIRYLVQTWLELDMMWNQFPNVEATSVIDCAQLMVR